MPDFGYADIQTSAEYIAWAVQRMAEETGEQVDVLGHSQGGFSPRWALNYFPGTRVVDDMMGLAPLNP